MRQRQVYAFIDSQNLNLGVSRDIIGRDGKILYKGWKLDYKKFRLYLKNKYGVSEAYLFIGNKPGHEALYSSLLNKFASKVVVVGAALRQKLEFVSHT